MGNICWVTSVTYYSIKIFACQYVSDLFNKNIENKKGLATAKPIYIQGYKPITKAIDLNTH